MFWRDRSSLPARASGRDYGVVACLHEPLGGIMAGLSALRIGRAWCGHEMTA